MKIKEGFVIRRVAESWAVIPVGKAQYDFNGMILINQTGAFLWNLLKEDTDIEQLTNALCKEYLIDENQAKEDVKAFIESIKPSNCLE